MKKDLATNRMDLESGAEKKTIKKEHTQSSRVSVCAEMLLSAYLFSSSPKVTNIQHIRGGETTKYKRSNPINRCHKKSAKRSSKNGNRHHKRWSAQSK